VRLLVIPAHNEASRGFPFPLPLRVARLKEGLLTCPPNHVDNWSVADSEIEVGDDRHTLLFSGERLPADNRIGRFLLR